MNRPSLKPYFRFLLVLLAGVAALTLPASAQDAPLRLTLHDAIEKGLQANLGVLVADTRVQELEGTRTRRLANLLPRVRTQSFANLQNRNLRAFGISFPGVPEVVGPFSNFDFRVYAEQNVFDLQSYHAWKASLRQLDSGKLDYQDARDLIVRSVAALYLNVSLRAHGSKQPRRASPLPTHFIASPKTSMTWARPRVWILCAHKSNSLTKNNLCWWPAISRSRRSSVSHAILA